MAAPPGAIALSATHGGTSRAATQLVIGEDVAPDGVQQAADNADPWWTSVAIRALRWLADSGRPFECYDLTELGVADPAHLNHWGPLFRAAHTAGLSQPHGYTSRPDATAAPPMTASKPSAGAATWAGAGPATRCHANPSPLGGASQRQYVRGTASEQLRCSEQLNPTALRRDCEPS